MRESTELLTFFQNEKLKDQILSCFNLYFKLHLKKQLYLIMFCLCFKLFCAKAEKGFGATDGFHEENLSTPLIIIRSTLVGALGKMMR